LQSQSLRSKTLWKVHKHLETVAERFVDLLADYGSSDEAMKDSLGVCDYLDAAINYYLDIDEEMVADDDDWD
jgi:hypothetical protein